MEEQTNQNPNQQTASINAIVTNFVAGLSRVPNGYMASGAARYQTTTGCNPFVKPTVLSFMEKPIEIGASVIDDVIVAAKERVENGILHVYAVGSSGKVYKIQVNDPTTKNPNYDMPVLLATLVGGFTFKYGQSIDFYFDHIFIGHDTGVVRIDFDGTNQTDVGVVGTWVANVPRPSNLFVGNIYFGNGNNIAEVTSGLIVNSYTRLNPGFPTEFQVRDLDVTSDGVYLVMTTVQGSIQSILSTDPDTTSIGAIDSTAAYWNGTNDGVTTFLSYPNYAQSAYATFSQYEFLFGEDPMSATLSTPQGKLLTLEGAQNPLPSAISNIGNLIAWMAPENMSIGAGLVAAIHAYGQFDQESQPAHYRLGSFPSTLTNGDVLKVPLMLPVSNYSKGGQQSGYSNQIVGTGKVYFSTIEYDGTTTKFGFYSFNLYPTGQGQALPGVFETQQELYAKKVTPKEVRVYLEPAQEGQSFRIDIIGIDGEILNDTSGLNVFTVGTNLDIGETLAWYNPKVAPTPAIGFRVTNLGTVTPFIHKVEIDPVHYGK